MPLYLKMSENINEKKRDLKSFLFSIYICMYIYIGREIDR